MTWRIAYPVARQIADHAQAQFPHEVCGLFAGRGKDIVRAIPVANISDTPLSQYSLEPNEQLRSLKALDEENLIWLGVYHSHPNSPPIPSSEDLEAVSDYGLLQLIVSLQRRRPQFKLWQLNMTGVNALDLVFDSQSPLDDDDEVETKQQKLAIVIAGAIGLILMLLISFTLLPPAPPLTHLP